MMKNTFVKTIFVMSLICLTLCGCSQVGQFKESDRIRYLTFNELEKKKNDGQDFWVYIGSKEDNECISYQSNLIAYLDKNDKELLFFDISSQDTKEEAFVEFFEGMGIEEDIPMAILHISKGYVIKQYQIEHSEAILDFENDYKKRDITADEYIDEISVPDMKKLYDSGEEFWVYFGRSSCKDCRAYYPELVEYLEEVEETIYYVVTDKNLLSEDDLAYLTDFREKYKIEEVPAILHINKTDLVRHYDMQKESDITEFEKDYHDCCSFLD